MANIKYEEAIRQIEEIVDRLENDDIDIDTLGPELKKAQKLIKMCKDKLTKTEEEVKKIAMLKMTPLDFITALEEVGVSYSQIKELCNTNEEVEKQLRVCNHVYRGNPLLDQVCGLINVTTEQLNELFKKYGT